MALNKPGEMIFFAEKYEEQLNSEGKKSISTAYLKLITWARSGNSKKIHDLYLKESGQLKTIITLPVTDQNMFEIAQAHQFYFYTLQFMIEDKDAVLIEEIMANLKVLNKNILAVKNASGMNALSILFCKLLFLYSQVEYCFYKNDLKKVEELLTEAGKMLSDDKTSINNMRPGLEDIYNNLELKLCLLKKDNDKTVQIYEKIGNTPPIFNDQKANYFENRSRLLYTMGDKKAAMNYMDSALMYQKKDVQANVEAYENLLYANIESEYNKLELENSLSKRSVLKKWVFVLIGIIVSVSGFAYYSVIRERRKSNERIKSLNNMTELAISEAMLFATREEQKKLGQDLHDDFSGSLLSLINQLEIIKQKESNPDLIQNLGDVEAQASVIYNSVRNKSHAIYNKADNPENDHFDDSLIRIINSAMPDSVYKKDIEISKDAISLLSMNQRIQILRIVQEAISNIIKYSKATEATVFLFLKDDKKTVLQISDNGIGLDKSILQKDSKKGLGFKSIRNRVDKLGGSMDIINDDGTTLLIEFEAVG